MTSLSADSTKRFLTSLRRRDRPAGRERTRIPPHRQNFLLEPLESRLLLSVSLVGIPDWTALGPGPITNAANVDLNGNNNPNRSVDNIGTGDAADVQVGAVEAIAVDKTSPGQGHVAIGSVNGGVWVTGNINAGTVAWTTNTDRLPSLAISAVAFSPTNGNIIYAGTGSYTNGAVGFQAGVANPASVTTGGSGGAAVGLYRSTDGGTTWSILGRSVFSGLRITDVVSTTLNGGQTVFVGTTDVNGPNTGGVYRSDDSGANWTRLSGGNLPNGQPNGLPNRGVTDLIADPNNANRFFTAVPGGVGAGVYLLDTTGGNAKWTNVSNNLPAGALAGERIRLSISAAGVHPIWAGAIDNTGLIQGVYRGVEGGAGGVTWTAVGPGGLPPDIYGNFPRPQGATNFSFVADPNADNLVYVGGDSKTPFPFTGNLARGDSTANTWTAISTLGAASGAVAAGSTTLPLAGVNPAKTAPHPDSRNMAFDGNNIIEVDDGGIYLLTNPTAAAAAPTWASLLGNLQDGEAYQVAVDTLNTATPADDVYLDAQQDDGANERSAAGAWQESKGGDGTIALADSVNGHRYFSSQNFNLVRRDGGGALVIPAGTINNPGAIAGLKLNAANGAAGTTQIENLPFFTVTVLNGSNPNRMLVGGNATLYESNDNGNTFRSIGGLNATNNGALGVAGLTGVVTAIAYGDTANANLAYVADANGNLLMTANITAAGGGFVATDFKIVAGGNAALGIVVDPNNANIAYAVTNTGVFRTTNGSNWTSIAGNILQVAQASGVNTLASIALFNNGTPTTTDDVLLVGGLGGVFRTPVSTLPNPSWFEYGQKLPNVLVSSLDYSAQGDTLVAGTYGRSVWSVSSVSTTIGVTGVVQINGDTDFAGEDDTIKLEIDANNISLLDVFLNGAESMFQLATIQQINVNGLGGNDTLIIDDSNGLISVPLGIRYDGGTGFNRLQEVQTGGPTRIADTYRVGPLDGSGISKIVDITGTQKVFFQNLAPVLDTVPAGPLTVKATPSDNAINYTSAAMPTRGKVTIDNQEWIKFSNKTSLVINTLAGTDTIGINNSNTPTRLTNITINGGDPSAGDTLNVTGVGVATPVIVDTGAQRIAGATGTAGGVPISYRNIASLNLLHGIGNLALNTAAADDTVVVTPGLAAGAGTNNSGTLQSNGADPQISFANDGALNLDLDGGSGALVVNGSQSGDAIDVDGAAVKINGRHAVNYLGVQALTVNGGGGSDRFNVTPSATTAMFIDGGAPIGNGDMLFVISPTGLADFFPGPQADQGSYVVFGDQPVSFTHIESSLVIFPSDPPDTSNINVAAAGIAADPILQLQNGSGTTLPTLNGLGLDGSDRSNVTTAASGRTRNLFVGAGLPSGKIQPADNLSVLNTPPWRRIISTTAAQDPDGGLVDSSYGMADFLAQYSDIEPVVISEA
jgi:hypothetical protein